MKQFQHMVAAVDFSEVSEKALALAVRLARQHGALLHIVHIVEKSGIKIKCQAEGLEWDEAAAQLTQEAHARCHQQFKDCQRFQRLMTEGANLPVKINIDIAIGDGFEELFRRTRDIPADILVLGADDPLDLDPEKNRLTYRLVTKVRCPVLLVRNSEGEPFQTILAGQDGSPVSKPLRELAMMLARADQAQLHLVQITTGIEEDWHFGSPCRQETTDMPPPEDDPEDATGNVNYHRQNLAAATPSKGLKVILAQHACDLLILGQRGHNTHALLGATAGEMIQESPCSVLIVKPPDLTWDLD